MCTLITKSPGWQHVERRSRAGIACTAWERKAKVAMHSRILGHTYKAGHTHTHTHKVSLTSEKYKGPYQFTQ